MEHIKRIYNTILCRPWIWLGITLMNCLSAVISMAREDQNQAGKFIVTACCMFAFSFVAKRFTLK